MSQHADLLEQITDKLAERVAIKLRPIFDDLAKRLAPPPAPMVFTTNKRGPFFPGKSRRWMLDHIKAMPGAHRVGRDWEISDADFEAWKRAEDIRLARAPTKRSLPQPVQSPAPLAADELARRAHRALQAAGFRRST